MGKRGEPRQLISLRLPSAGIAQIDGQAKRVGRSRSEMIRVMLAYASANMPKDWTP